LKEFISLETAAGMIKDGSTLMIGGFLGIGNPHRLVEAMLNTGVKDLTIISDDSPPTGFGLSKLIDERRVARMITSHVGMNANVAKQVYEGTLTVDLIPQGSLAEMVRAGGSGLGGIITPTGVDTIVEESPFCHGRITIDERDYLIMKPLHADIALISAHTVDRSGNVWLCGTTRNFNEIMPYSADIVICEADHVVEVGEIEPENVMVPGILVDYIIDCSGDERRFLP